MAFELQSFKNKAVHFNIKKDTVSLSLKFQDRDLEFVSSYTHLGVIFSEDFSWTVYINSIIVNARKELGLMKKNLIS